MAESVPRRGCVLIAGGGTAGHVLPGIAVAQQLLRMGLDTSEVHFVGSTRGPEGELVEAAGFGVTLLPGRGIQRRLNLENLRSAVQLLRSLPTALALVRRARPRVVLVLGGYASLACAFAAVLSRVPIVVADQNARAGAVNRLTARFARVAAVPFESTDLPRKVLTGNPVRGVVIERARNRDPRAARGELGLPADGVVLAVFAGSLGAERVNAAVWEALGDRWSGRSDLAVAHVLGARGWERRPDPHRDPGPVTDGGPWYSPVRYEHRMELLLDAADLVVCRAGGTTVAELTVMGTPSVLVPLPIATRDHQSANAAELVAAGAALCVPDAEMDAHRLASEVDRLIDTPSVLESMAAAAGALGRPGAAEAVAGLVMHHAR